MKIREIVLVISSVKALHELVIEMNLPKKSRSIDIHSDSDSSHQIARMTTPLLL